MGLNKLTWYEHVQSLKKLNPLYLEDIKGRGGPRKSID